MNHKKCQIWEFLTRPLPSPQSFPGLSQLSRSFLNSYLFISFGLCRLSPVVELGLLIMGLLLLWGTALHPEAGEVWLPLLENAAFVCDGLRGPFWF